MRKFWVVLLALVVSSGSAFAAVKPHGLFTDNAVLQQGVPVPVWGTASDGEKVTVKLNGQEVSTTAQDGKWMVRLKPLKAGGPFTLTIAGENTIELKNVLVGEVWICSGQSNMQRSVTQSANPQETAANSKDSMLRLFTVQRRAADAPESDLRQGNWSECAPDTVPSFSAVAYFFGRDLRKALNVPVGLISTNVGGTPAEAWTRRGVLESDPMLRGYLERHELAVKNYPQALERFREAEAKAKAEGKQPPRPPADPAQSAQRPCGLYNAMIAPLIPYAIKGAIWYQGESNAGRAYEYRTLFPAMIRNWREDWKQGDFSFLFVQLAPFMQIVSEPQESAWAELREAQLLTLKTPKTGMAVITDAGDPNDIHPKQKEPVGARLALAARRIAYGERIVHSGPIYRSMKVEGNKVTLTFNNVGGGLVAKDGELKGFAIAGEDKKFVNAQAEIQGNTVVVWSSQIEHPVAVRYGWANCPVVNLFNKAGLPASPFRTDDFPMVTGPK
jgi:sialate O-acetylesterase